MTAEDKSKSGVNIIDVSGFIYRVFYAFPSLSYNMPLSKPSESELQQEGDCGLQLKSSESELLLGDTERRSGAYLEVREHSSTGSTQQETDCGGFEKREVGALYGFCIVMLKLTSRFPNSMFIAACDHSRQTFRNEIYDGYKANRATVPEALLPQIPLIKEACSRFGFVMAELPGFEADDIIATYTSMLRHRYGVNIISSDKDLMQLICDDQVTLYDPVKHRYITEEDVIKKFGVTPDKVLDVLAIIGDDADNIPGITKIGQKTAAAWINEFGSLENLIANLEKLPPSKRRTSLAEEAHIAVMSKKLVALRCDLDLPFEYKVATQNGLSDFFKLYGFNSLLKMAD
ncbi:MAG: hypothetical protein LBJ69_01060 [Holosporales bacterium]|jgi:DNA polymerase-1|nr:hypothetical protein [Holosporales bacterium]